MNMNMNKDMLSPSIYVGCVFMLLFMQAADFFADNAASRSLSSTTAVRLFQTDADVVGHEIGGEPMMEVCSFYDHAGI